MNFEFIEPSSSDDPLMEMPAEVKKNYIKTEPNPLLVEVDAGHYGELLSAAGYKKPIKNENQPVPTEVAVFIKTEPPLSPEHYPDESTIIKYEEYGVSNTGDIINSVNREIFVQDFIKTESLLDESNHQDHQPSKTKLNVKKQSSSSSKPIKSRKRSKTKPTKEGVKTYECATCQKVFSKRSCIIKHLQIHLPRTRTYKCQHQHCEFTCHNRNAVRKHMWIHMKEKKFECYLCRGSFESRKLMKEHMVSEHCNSDQFIQICCFCSQTYKTRKEVEDHENRTHRMERLNCVTCGKEFISMPGLRGHIQRFHTNNFVKRPDPVPCPVCNKIMSSKSALRDHLKRHDGKRPYICDTCGDSFKFPTCLKIHQRIHSGEKRWFNELRWFNQF